MSKVCELTGKARFRANKVSHSNIKTRRFKYPNIVRKRWVIPELGQTLTLTLSASAFRTIAARGSLAKAILMEREENLSERLLAVRRALVKRNRTSAPVAAGAEAKHEI